MTTSSMRHFVKYNCDHIFITEGYYSFIFAMVKFNISPKNFDYTGARARTCAHQFARKKKKNAQNRLKLIFPICQAINLSI